MFTVAVLADIHGNLDAPDAVLADPATQRHDIIVLAGDLLTGGPQPVKTLQRIREIQMPTIFGNTDRAITQDGTTWIITHRRVNYDYEKNGSGSRAIRTASGQTLCPDAPRS